MSNKGQWYLIIAIFIIIILTLIKTSLNMLEIIENKRALELGFEKQEFQNFRNEMLKTVGISYFKSQNISNDVIDFIKYGETSFAKRAMQLDAFFAGSSFLTVTANENIALNVTVFNNLGKSLITLNLTFNGTNQNYTSVLDAATIKTNFTFSTSTAYNYTLRIFYQLTDENRTEEVTIPAEIGKSKFVGFFDIKLISNKLEQRDKFSKIYTLSS